MKQTVILAFLAGANIFVILLLQWYVITQLGVGSETDALFAGMVVPQLILAVVSSSLTHVLVPVLATTDRGAFYENAWGFFWGISAVFAILALISIATASYWVPWLFPGFTEAGAVLAVRLTRIQLLSMVFTASVSVLWSVYHAQQRFIWAELAALLAGTGALLVVTQTLTHFGIAAAAWAMVLRTALQVVLLLPGLGAPRHPHWRSTAMKDTWKRLRPLLLGASYYRTDLLIDRFLSSLAGTGGLSLLYLGQQIYGVANFLLEKAITSPMVPLLAKQARQCEWLSLRETFRRRLILTALITGAVYLVFILAGEWFLTLLVGHGGVTRENVRALWIIMVALGGLLIGGAMGQITSATFYAIGDTRTPTRLSVLSFTLYVPLKFLAFLRYGLIGLAVATTLYYLGNLFVQIIVLEGFTLKGNIRRRSLSEEVI